MQPGKLQERIVEMTRAAQKSDFETSELGVDVRAWTDDLNASSERHKKKPWLYEHLLNPQTGRYTFHARRYEYTQGVTKVLNYQDQLRFWAYSKYAIDTALRTQGAAESAASA